MKTKLLALLLLTSVTAHAVIIEDSADRLIFDLEWTAPSWLGIDLQGGGIGRLGSDVYVLPGRFANPYRFVVEVHQAGHPWWTFLMSFQGWNEDGGPSHPPDAFWGTMTQPTIGTILRDHLFAVEGNDHAVRVVIGALPVPDYGCTLPLLAFALTALAFSKRALMA